MKHISLLLIFIFCAICLFGECRLDAGIIGTGSYNMIDEFNSNKFHQTSNSDEYTQQSSNGTSNFTSLTNNQQLIIPRVSMLNYNAALARKIGLSTLMMSGVLYGLTVLPALVAMTGVGPLAGLFSSLGRRKRSLVNESHIFRQMPLLDNEETVKFLKLFESTLQARKIWSSSCRRYYICKVYFNAIKNGQPKTLATLENAIVNVFGIAVERKDFKLDLVPTVKMYYDIAKDALNGKSCALKYPCFLQTTNNQRDSVNDSKIDLKS